MREPTGWASRVVLSYDGLAVARIEWDAIGEQDPNAETPPPFVPTATPTRPEEGAER